MRDQGVWFQCPTVALDQSVLDALARTVPRQDLPAIFRAFAADLARLAADFASHAEAGRAEAARRTAHALAGAAAGVGARGLEAAARAVMEPGAPPVGPAQAAAIATEAAAVVAALEALAA